jgi:hypothetical protein
MFFFAVSAAAFLWVTGVSIKGYSRHSSSGDRAIVTPETSPVEFWMNVIGISLLAVIAAWRGLIDLRSHRSKLVGRGKQNKRRRKRRKS